MHAIIRFVIPCLICTTVTTFAQSPAAQDSADLAWLNVTTLLTKDKQKAGSPAQAGLKQQADRFLRASQNAKDFYTDFPTHPKAAAAKKLEAVDALKAVEFDSARLGEANALGLCGSFRTNKANPIKDRFEVAVAVERYQANRRLNGGLLINHGDEGETIADGLRIEFGDLAEVYGLYTGLVRDSDMATASRIARKVLQLPAPKFAKDEAQATIDRYALIGQPLNISLKTAAGGTIELKAPSGKTTLVGLASNEAAFAPYRNQVKTEVRWIYVVLGLAAATPVADTGHGAGNDIHCVEPLGLESPVIVALKLHHLPYVFVISDKGLLLGYGRPEELPVLLALVKP